MNKKSNGQFRWIYAHAKKNTFLMVFMSLIVLATSAITVYVAQFLRRFVDVATGQTDRAFSYYLFGTLILLAVSGIFIYILSVCKARLFGQIEGRLRDKVIKNIFTRNFIDIQSFHSGEMNVLLSDDIAEVSRYFPTLINGLLRNVALSLMAIGMMFFLSWHTSIVILLAMPMLMIIMNLFSPLLQKASRRLKEEEEDNRKYMQESVGNILLFKAYAMVGRILATNKKLYGKKYKSQIALAKVEGISTFANMVMGSGMFIIILGVGALLVQNGVTTVGVLVAMLTLIGNATSPLSTLSEYITQMAKSNASAERLRAK